jgi:hypothetical protein
MDISLSDTDDAKKRVIRKITKKSVTSAKSVSKDLDYDSFIKFFAALTAPMASSL